MVEGHHALHRRQRRCRGVRARQPSSDTAAATLAAGDDDAVVSVTGARGVPETAEAAAAVACDSLKDGRVAPSNSSTGGCVSLATSTKEQHAVTIWLFYLHRKHDNYTNMTYFILTVNKQQISDTQLRNNL